MLPLTVVTVVQDILGPTEGEQFALSSIPHSTAAPTHTDLDVTVLALDEIQQRVTLQVTGYHVCQPACSWNDRVRLFSLIHTPQQQELPPSASITLPPSLDAVSQTVQLPLRGLPLRFPFDQYELRLGITLERVHADNTVEPLPPAEAPSHLFVTVQERLPEHVMDAPVSLDPQTVQTPSAPFPYVYVAALRFHRLLYVQVLAVLLVLLVTAAAAYAVFLRPFQDLIISAGGLILGIWGIRGILTPASVRYVTAVDLSLAVVIIFLLGAITLRALGFFYQRSELPVPRLFRK